MRTAYLDALYELAEKNRDVLALISDNGAIVYDKFRGDFPEQYLNCGISEASMVALAAGLASCGKIPFAYTISPFLVMRAYEFVRNDVCLQKQNVKLVGTGAGFVYSTLGPTHHATEDLAVLRSLPGLTILSPASPLEVRKATIAAAQHEGPVYLRLGTNKEAEIYDTDYDFTIGKAVVLKEGRDVTLISTGSISLDVMTAAKELESEGISCKVLNIHTVKPLDKEAVIEAALTTKAILSVEEHSVIGGLGGAVAEVLAENCLNGIVMERMGLCDCFCKGYGTHKELKAANGLGIEDIKLKAHEILKVKGKNNIIKV